MKVATTQLQPTAMGMDASGDGRQFFPIEGSEDRPTLTENKNPNIVSGNALGELISSRLKDSDPQSGVAAMITRLETTISGGTTPNASPSKPHLDACDTFGGMTSVPQTGPPMLEAYDMGPPITPPARKLPETEPNLASMRAGGHSDTEDLIEGEELNGLRLEAFQNAERAFIADEDNLYQVAHDLYLLVVKQFMRIMPHASEEVREKLTQTSETIIKRIEELREVLGSSVQSFDRTAAEFSTTGTNEGQRRETEPIRAATREESTGGSCTPAHKPSEVPSSGSFGHLRARGATGSPVNATNSTTKSLTEKLDALYFYEDNFVDLMMGGDHTGEGRGRSQAFSLNSQITSLSACTFGEMKRLEPLRPMDEERWRRGMRVYIKLADNIVHRVTETKTEDGETIQIMGERQREDIAENLPVLKSYDERLHRIIGNFKGLENHIKYKPRHPNQEQSSDNKWWVDKPVVQTGGCSRAISSQLLSAYEEISNIYENSRRINGNIVANLEVPQRFIMEQPKHAREVIGKPLVDALMNWPVFKVEQYLKERSIWNERDAYGCATLLERTSLIWKTRLNQPRTFRDRWKKEKNAKIKCAQKRAETAVAQIRESFPRMPHTKLDEAKIQDNTDIGKSILEAYSRALETRAARVILRIEEVLQADAEARRQAAESDS